MGHVVDRKRRGLRQIRVNDVEVALQAVHEWDVEPA